MTLDCEICTGPLYLSSVILCKFEHCPCYPAVYTNKVFEGSLVLRISLLLLNTCNYEPGVAVCVCVCAYNNNNTHIHPHMYA